ncbi:probable sodium/metabolite cotransporter BASS4, chloroplastic isoform X3 [Pyrus x bretschneideri]|uniref:probable sodium/metabolite cotransporter BASS4, chloroplastic isoform X3 n=1 Tax=Pyrus x bretschneideri TaxID=225117 RepID=UPI00202F1BBC|nr:probable sodium/metabolite cotransporter BASS4, chloroplastic isoform X3 [Pyrus x bretschneideri]
MAGTIQALILTPPPAQTLPFAHRLPHFPSKHAAFRFNHRLSRCISNPVKACQHPDQKDGNGNKAHRHSGSVKSLNWAKPLSNFVANNFLPLALVGGVALGIANPSLGCLADTYSLSKFSTFGIFIISGLTLHTGEIVAAAEAWPVGIFGLVSILLFTPYFSRLILQLQLQPQEFVRGLALFCCMPTTLSSGVALTQLAGANSALALAMTVISNLLGILIVPFSISKFVADGVGVSVPTKQLFKSLVLTLLIPLILGKICRESFRGVADFVDQNRKLFSKLSAIFLSLVPWIQVSRSRSLLLMVKPPVFLVAIGMGILLHIGLFVFNALAVKGVSALSGGSRSVFSKKENATAVLLVASQVRDKTLPVMVAVVEQLGGALGESGLLVLPCVAAHLNQIIMDSFLVNFWLRKDLSTNSTKVS